ncbi:MAG: rod shape-determining protein [Clostridia bacterium]|nr:rod shape-determining protein [Clostridia bacterium]
MAMTMDFGIDLGTANTLIYDRKKGIILNEPSIAVKNKKNKQFIAIGADAIDMIGRTPDGAQTIRPIRNGVITSFQGTVSMLKHFIKKSAENSFLRPRAVICVPCGITEVERRAVVEAANNAGIKEVCLFEQTLAAAIGSGVPIGEPHGSMVVNIGAGVTEIAVISLGGIVVSNTTRTAGEAFDNAIIQYVKRKYNMSIGDVTAEQIKCSIGAVYRHKDGGSFEMMGRDLLTGLPKTAKISSDDVRIALEECADEIVDAIKITLENTPPELASDIIESGIVLTGGGALLKGLGKLINVNVDIPVYIAEEPMNCVAIGAGKSLEYMTEMGFTMRSMVQI